MIRGSDFCEKIIFNVAKERGSVLNNIDRPHHLAAITSSQIVVLSGLLESYCL